MDKFEELKKAANAIGLVFSYDGIVYQPILLDGRRYRKADGTSYSGVVLQLDQQTIATRRFEYLEKCAKANGCGNVMDRFGAEWVPVRGRKVHRPTAPNYMYYPTDFDPDQQAFLEAAWAKLDRPKKMLWAPLDSSSVPQNSFEIIPAITLSSAQAIYVTQAEFVESAERLAAKLGIPLFTSREGLEKWAAE